MQNPILTPALYRWYKLKFDKNKKASATGSLIVYIIKSKATKQFALIALISCLLQFIIFKSLYPYPDFFSDSYSYILAAYAHLDVNIWPIGYSKFLSIFHSLTHSDTALISFQYFTLELSALYFFFTWLYFYSPSKLSQIILFIFLFFNPLFLYICNYVNSDPLFASLSIFWFTELLWILNKPRTYHILTQGILLLLCFSIRNNAYYYPFVSAFAFLISKQHPISRLVGGLFGPILISIFIVHTRAAAKQLTGTAQYSYFTGWQLANNALYIYDKISIDSKLLPTKSAILLNSYAKFFFSNANKEALDDALQNNPGNFFIQYQKSPLKIYFLKNYQWNNDLEYISNWGKASNDFIPFGSYIIQKYPLKYLRYFVLLNAKNYFIPPLEKLEIYNLGSSNVQPIAQHWFDLKSTSIASVSNIIQGRLLYIFPTLFLAINILCFGGVIWITVSNNLIISVSLRQFLSLSYIFLILNMGFCLISTIVVLRYLFFPMLIGLALVLILFDIYDTTNSNKII
jgi:hypothetical protein